MIYKYQNRRFMKNVKYFEMATSYFVFSPKKQGMGLQHLCWTQIMGCSGAQLSYGGHVTIHRLCNNRVLMIYKDLQSKAIHDFELCKKIQFLHQSCFYLIGLNFHHY